MAAAQDVAQCRVLSEEAFLTERPDTLIGGIEVVEATVLAPALDGQSLSRRPVTCSIGAENCVGEIIANVGDCLHSDPVFRAATARGTGRKPSRAAMVVQRSGDVLTVRNEGSGITTKAHPETGEPIIKMLFGQMRAGTNFDGASGEKINPTAGRNGCGTAIVNILSERFAVKVDDPGRGRYEIVWADGRSRVDKEKFSDKSPPKSGSVTVSATLKWSYFGMSGFTDDAWRLTLRHVFDTAAYTGAKVRIVDGDAKFDINLGKEPMLEYAKMHAAEGAAIAFDRVDSESGVTAFEVAAWLEPGEGASTTAGLVNGLRADEGKHVEFARKAILDVVRAEVKIARKKARSANSDAVSPRLLEEMVGVLVSVTLVNSQFDNQVKSRLMTTRSKWRLDGAAHPGWKPSAKFVKALKPVIEAVMARLDGAVDRPKKAASKSRLGQKYPKYTGARHAGNKEKRERCRLIVTEGDSAKAMALSGARSREDKDFFGAVPLKGKLANPRKGKDSNETAMLAEVLGLEPGRKYREPSDLSSLRYGEVWIMTDQDVDGWHIAGLLLNWFDTRMPGLLSLKPGFVKIFATPLVVVGDRHFYSEIEYKAWWDAAPASERRRVEYYKGLGAWTTAKAKRLFDDPRLVAVEYNPVEGAVASADTALEIAFDDRKSEARRQWLDGEHAVDETRLVYDPSRAVDFSLPSTTVTGFCEGALLHYWFDDNSRSLPSLCDGLKLSQRKAIYAVSGMSPASEPVQRLAAKICDRTHYHHGAVSMEGVVVTLAQSYVGTNNVPLLRDDGQFGSRFSNAAAASRYIKSCAHPVLPLVFCPKDAPLLEHVEVDGHRAEPVAFRPVIPWGLVNGIDGIGSGYRSVVPPHNPEDIIATVRARVRGGAPVARLYPWYRGWTGEVVRIDGGWEMHGVFERRGHKIRITDLPPRLRIDAWKKKVLENFPDVRIVDSSTSDATDLEVDGLQAEDDEQVVKKLGLISKTQDYDIVFLDADGKPHRYGSTEAVIDAWWPWRRDGYQSRHAHLVQALEEKARLASRRAQFVRDVIAGRVEVVGKPRGAVVARLAELGYVPDAEGGGYASLLKLPIHTLTAEEALAQDAAEREARDELAELRGRTWQDLWMDDLDALECALAAPPPHKRGSVEGEGEGKGKKKKRVIRKKKRPPSDEKQKDGARDDAEEDGEGPKKKRGKSGGDGESSVV